MKLIKPVQPPTINQVFEANANPTYGQAGLKGHGAIDYGGYYGEPIYAACDAYIYSIVDDNPNPAQYRAVYSLVDDGQFVYEVSYGHIIDSPRVLGDVKQGEVIARMGNYGNVWSGGRQVTADERRNGSQAGTHLHFQVRKCIKVSKKTNGKLYITDSNGSVKWNGNFIEYFDFDNGYNSCVDPQPFFADQTPTLKYQFSRDLFFGIKGGDVVALQKFLNSHQLQVAPSGAGSPGHETDYYGPLTLNAVAKFQALNGIAPEHGLGFFDHQSRDKANSFNVV